MGKKQPENRGGGELTGASYKRKMPKEYILFI